MEIGDHDVVTVVHLLNPTTHPSFNSACATSLPGVLLVTGQDVGAWNVPLGAALLSDTMIVPVVAVRGTIDA